MLSVFCKEKKNTGVQLHGFFSNKNKMNYVVVTPYNTFCYVRIPNGRGHNDTRECIEHFCERHVSFLGEQ